MANVIFSPFTCKMVKLCSFCQGSRSLLTRFEIIRNYSNQDRVWNDYKVLEGEEFRVLVIPGHTKLKSTKQFSHRRTAEVLPPRYQTMKTDQDWTNVWPTAHTFKWSVVPFPVRQGVRRADENKGIPPGKYGNLELMKIPNFLHLTPNHVKKHCAAIKPFCTEWPKELDSDAACDHHFPLTFESRNFIMDAPSVRDSRARVVTLRMKLSQLKLDAHARDKLLRLVGDQYNLETDILTLKADRCPLQKQNKMYTLYLLTALYHESWKKELWENEKTDDDQEVYIWEERKSSLSLLQILESASKSQLEKGTSLAGTGIVGRLKVPSERQELLNYEEVRNYKHAVEHLYNKGETLESIEQYKSAAKSLLLQS